MMMMGKETTPSQRAQFSSTEMALQSFFELLSFTCTIVFSRPEQFKYPVLISYTALGVAAVCYAVYVRKVRGHLVHVSRCVEKRGANNIEIRGSLGSDF